MTSKELFIATHKVANLIFSYTSPEPTTPLTKPFLQDRRGSAPPWASDRTESGLYLAYRFRRPRAIRTPWGVWNFAGDGVGDWEPLMLEIHQRLGAVKIEDEEMRHGRLYGPRLKLTRIDDEILPEATLPLFIQKLSNEEAYHKWRDFSRQFPHLTR